MKRKGCCCRLPAEQNDTRMDLFFLPLRSVIFRGACVKSTAVILAGRRRISQQVSPKQVGLLVSPTCQVKPEGGRGGGGEGRRGGREGRNEEGQKEGGRKARRKKKKEGRE